MKESISIKLGRNDITQALEEYIDRHMTQAMSVVSWEHPKQNGGNYGGSRDEDSIEVVLEPRMVKAPEEIAFPLHRLVIPVPGELRQTDGPDDGPYKGRSLMRGIPGSDQNDGFLGEEG